MFVADAHCDTLYAVAIDDIKPSDCKVNRETMEKGGVGLQCFALFAGAEGPAGDPAGKAQKMLRAAAGLNVPILTGKLPETPPEAPAGVITVEGGEIFRGSLEALREMHAAWRVRMIALTWNNENEIAHPAKNDTGEGLKPFGRRFVREMEALGILPDVSHLNERGFYDLSEATSLPLVASHSNLKKLCDVPRNLTERQVKLIAQRKGFIGLNFYSAFLASGREAALEDLLRQADAVAELGGIEVLGFGSDFDGIDRWPAGLESPADFPALIELLRRHGYTEAQLRGIAGENLYRLLRSAEKD